MPSGVPNVNLRFARRLRQRSKPWQKQVRNFGVVEQVPNQHDVIAVVDVTDPISLVQLYARCCDLVEFRVDTRRFQGSVVNVVGDDMAGRDPAGRDGGCPAATANVQHATTLEQVPVVEDEPGQSLTTGPVESPKWIGIESVALICRICRHWSMINVTLGSYESQRDLRCQVVA